jgi:hypothetical protein
LCKKAAAWKIDRTNRSSDRNFSYDNFSARSALSRSEKAILLVLERAEFLHNQGQLETIQPNSRRGRFTLNSGLDGKATVRRINARPMHRNDPFIRSVGGGEKRWRDGYVRVQGTDDAQMSVWVFTIYGGLRLCGDPRPRMSKSPHTSDDQLMLDLRAGNSSGDPSWPSFRLRRADYRRTELGTSSGPFVANGPPSLALPLRPASKIYERQLMDPTFANEFLTPKAVYFQDFGAGDGNRTHDIQLGKVCVENPFLIVIEMVKPHPGRRLGTFSGLRAALVRSSSDRLVGDSGLHCLRHIVDAGVGIAHGSF